MQQLSIKMTLSQQQHEKTYGRAVNTDSIDTRPSKQNSQSSAVSFAYFFLCGSQLGSPLLLISSQKRCFPPLVSLQSFRTRVSPRR